MPQGYPFTREDADRIMDRFVRMADDGECPHPRLCESFEQCLKKDLNDLGRPYFRHTFLNGWHGGRPERESWRARDGENRGMEIGG